MAKIRTRARAVDMLGRQQIASVQNAFAELFKNAYDAYATRVQVDFFKDIGPDKGGMLLVRDDGFGMTRQDFEDKWLVLGTESKAGNNRTPSYVPNGMSPRVVTGEKGIGRLAIALLGRQVIVFTRAKRSEGLSDLVVSWIHWGVFEIPGLNLDDIDFPVITFPGGKLPGGTDLAELKRRVVSGLTEGAVYEANSELCRKLVSEIEAFNPSLAVTTAFLQQSSDGNGLSLEGIGTGTQFLIGSVNPMLDYELREEDRNQDYGFRKLLLGFADRVFGDSIDFHTSFKVWEKGGFSADERLDDDAFFTRDEVSNLSDHFLSGTVDAYGQFSGSLRVYEDLYPDLKIPWADAKGRKTECGPFKVLFGVIQGVKSESLLAKKNEDAYLNLDEKTDKIGGVYLYRDGIRILPYGDHSFDWLDVEKNRTKSAAYYFFSYRRMFGAVLLTHEANSALQEKAGREGLQKNLAYQQLRGIMKNLLAQIVADFFRKDGIHTEVFEKNKAEINAASQALERRMKQSRVKLKMFQGCLDKFFKDQNDGQPSRLTEQLLVSLSEKMRCAATLDNPDQAATQLIGVERFASDELDRIKKRFEVKRPVGVGLPRRVQQDWLAYRESFEQLVKDVFKPCEEEIMRLVGETARQARLYIDQRKRLEDRLAKLAAERRKQLDDAAREAEENAGRARNTVMDITKKARLALNSVIDSIQTDMNRTPLQNLTEKEIDALRVKWENELTSIEEQHRKGVDAAREMFGNLAAVLATSGGEEPSLEIEAMEKRVFDLENQSDQDFEMVQLGTAVAIINHEFLSAITQIRHGLRDLREIARTAKVIEPTYEKIRVNFEHLDAHLKLFTPLQRRMQRQKLVISGQSMKNYIWDVFSGRFVRHNVSLDCSSAFLASTVECFPSTLYPALINLVDNAFYWLKTVSIKRCILLDVCSDAVIIANNGPKIELRDEERIFERGFSRKDTGRGLGLFISAKALEGEKMSLTLESPPKGFNVAFHIHAPSLKKGSGDEL